MKLEFACGLRLASIAMLVVALSGCLRLSAPPVSGSLAGNLFWSGEVRLSGDVVLEPQARLTIAPGTRVLFETPRAGQDLQTEHPYFSGSELIVKGALVAEGTAAEPITFAASDPQAPAGSWGAINIEGSPEVRFRHCRFIQADSAVHSRDSRVFIQESVFENNLVGIRFHSTAMLIENNLLHCNGSGIRFHFGAPVIRYNEIRDNDRGIFITSFPRDYQIENNNIVNNREYSVVFGEDVPEDVIMTHNFWGTDSALMIEGEFFDGRRSGYLGKVVYAPLSETPHPKAGPSWNR